MPRASSEADKGHGIQDLLVLVQLSTAKRSEMHELVLRRTKQNKQGRGKGAKAAPERAEWGRDEPSPGSPTQPPPAQLRCQEPPFSP